ncbi:MAG: ATP-binding cassette domain-containing protein, partial [Flavobacteriales bacterium]|nr:ATP-binding cassette domain-containing protein [Flavobacteriales bacterium]
PIKGFSQGYSGIVRGSSSAQRVFELLAVPNTVVEKPDAKPVAAFRDKVEFRDVAFAYGEKPVLQGIHLSVAKGKSVALVGGSGGGKTTLAGLLPRFFDVTAGAVLLDGTDIRDLRIRDLRALMGIVTQDSLLFNDTVAANIAFGRTGISEADIQRAAEVANAHEFITRLPQGYHTSIGDAGNR